MDEINPLAADKPTTSLIVDLDEIDALIIAIQEAKEKVRYILNTQDNPEVIKDIMATLNTEDYEEALEYQKASVLLAESLSITLPKLLQQLFEVRPELLDRGYEDPDNRIITPYD